MWFLGSIQAAITMSLPARPVLTTHTLQDKMDLAIGVALGSSIQIAIFVLPLVVIIGWAIGKPLTLDLDPFLIMILTLSVIHANFVSSDGQSNWWVPCHCKYLSSAPPGTFS